MTHETLRVTTNASELRRRRTILHKGAVLALAIACGALPMSSPALAASHSEANNRISKSSDVEIPTGKTTQGEPEVASCGAIYGLRRDRPHNVESIDPVTGNSTVHFTMGDSAKWLNGLGLDRNTKTFWAVQQNGTDATATVSQPAIFAYDSHAKIEKKYRGTKILTPLPRESMVAGAFNPNNNIYYYGQLHGDSFYVYGFDAEKKAPISGIIAVIRVGNYTNGDFAFDSAGRLYIAADGMLLVTQSALPAVGSEDPPKIAARGIAKLSDSPLGSGAFGSDGLLYVADGPGTILTVDPSSGQTVHTAKLQRNSNLLSDFASCSPPRTLTLMKDLPDGRATTADQFELSIKGGGLTDGNVGTTSGNEAGLQTGQFADYAGPVAVKPGATYQLSELGVTGTSAEKYDSRWSCSLNDTVLAEGTGVNGSVTVPESPGGGTDIACTFTNTLVNGLTSTKTASPVSGSTVQANDTITYTLNFTNSSSKPASVNTTDDLSGVLQNAVLVDGPSSSSKDLHVVANGQTLAIQGSVAEHSSATVQYTVRVLEKDTRANATIVNTLRGCESPEDCTTEHSVAALGVTKAAESEIGVVRYTVVVTNTGSVPYSADNPATMSDDLSDVIALGAMYRGDAQASAGEVTLENNVLRWSGALDVGESVSITYSIATAEADTEISLPNSACVPVAGQDPECASTLTPVPPATRNAPVCVGPECVDRYPEYTKELEGVDTEIGADAEADYVVKIKNPHADPLHIELIDYLDDVLDDATVIGDPISSLDAITVDRSRDKAWNISGDLDPGQSVQVRYRIRINSAEAAGNRILNNYIVPPGFEQPKACEPKEREDKHCTTHIVPGPRVVIGSLSAGKSAEPATGSPLRSGDIVTYTLRFANSAVAEATVDTFDDLNGVLNNAEIVTEPRSSNSNLQAVLKSGRIEISGKMPAGSFTTITYSVRVKPHVERISNEILNVLDGCTEGQQCKTQHPIRHLSVAKSASASADRVDYTVTVTNSGAVPYTAEAPATMRDDLSKLAKLGAVFNGDAVASVGTASVAGNTLNWSGALGVGESATVTYSVGIAKVAGNSKLSNVACVPVPGESESCASTETSLSSPPPVPPSTTNPISTPPLARTGSDSDLLAWLGAMAAVGGAIAFTARRLRHRRAGESRG